MAGEQEAKQKPQWYLRPSAELAETSAHILLAKASFKLYSKRWGNISFFLNETAKLHGKGMSIGKGK